MDWLGLIISIMRYGMLVVLGWFLWLLLGAIKTDLQQTQEFTNNQTRQERRKRVSASGGPPLMGLEVVVSTSDKLLPGQVFPIGREITIGRDQGNQVVVEDAFSSNRHARVWTEAGICRVEDLESTNGTFLNGQKLQETVIFNLGDLLKVGGATFRLIN